MSKLAMPDPKRDLAGATPEELARALLRPLRPRSGVEAVVRNKVAVQRLRPVMRAAVSCIRSSVPRSRAL